MPPPRWSPTPERERPTAYAAAVRLLARREHARSELEAKLRQRGFPAAEVAQALLTLAEQGYLSDARFAELYTRQRIARGFGESRIRAELAERGVEPAVAQAALAPFAGQWPDIVRRTARRRFGEAGPADRREWLRRARFLQARGFHADHIRGVLEDYE